MELKIEHLSKRFKDKTAVDDVSLTLTSGVWGLLGANGAGKTTLMRMIADIMVPTNGAIYYDTYSLDTKTKKLTYQVTDWVVRCSGEPCMGREAVYATEGYGFLCLPRNVTQRLAERHYQFAEADAWLDLWCHTVWQESSNAFSFSAPAVQFGQYGAVLTLESLGRRWGWEKTKVWRFFRKHADAFPLYKLPGAFGCLIFNAVYPTGEQFTLPSQDKVERILREIRTKDGNTHENQQSDHARICKLVAWYSRAVLPREQEERRVASEDCYITRAYFSPCKTLEYVREDCQGISPATPNFELFRGTLPRAGPADQDDGGIENGRFEGIPLW